MLMLWLPVVSPVLLSFVCLVGDQHIVKEVALVHGPDLYCHSPNVTQVVQGRLILKVVRVGDLLGLPYTLQVSDMLLRCPYYLECILLQQGTPISNSQTHHLGLELTISCSSIKWVQLIAQQSFFVTGMTLAAALIVRL